MIRYRKPIETLGIHRDLDRDRNLDGERRPRPKPKEDLKEKPFSRVSKNANFGEASKSLWLRRKPTQPATSAPRRENSDGR